MFVSQIETLMADLSELFITPILLIICAMFIYALFELGQFLSQAIIRKKYQARFDQSAKLQKREITPGFPVHNYFVNNPKCLEEEVDIFALKQLENLRIVTKVSPMLGLIATMIPMGPALKSLADGNIQGISENLIIAFAAVIWALIISAITFWPASVKKRWYAAELVNVRKLLKEEEQHQPKVEAAQPLQGAA